MHLGKVISCGRSTWETTFSASPQLAHIMAGSGSKSQVFQNVRWAFQSNIQTQPLLLLIPLHNPEEIPLHCSLSSWLSSIHADPKFDASWAGLQRILTGHLWGQEKNRRPNRHERRFLHEFSQPDSPLLSMLTQSSTVRSQTRKAWLPGTFLTTSVTALSGHPQSQEP